MRLNILCLSEMVIISKLNASLQEFGDTIVYKNILNIEEILVEAKDTKILEDTDVYIFQSKNAAIISQTIPFRSTSITQPNKIQLISIKHILLNLFYFDKLLWHY